MYTDVEGIYTVMQQKCGATQTNKDMLFYLNLDNGKRSYNTYFTVLGVPQSK